MIDKIDFSKSPDGLVPVIVQDKETAKVLMLGYMNEEAYKVTLDIRKVTFYSRSKQRLWTKGEASGNFLILENILIDCDNDTILIKAKPLGPVCHTGGDTCFAEKNEQPILFLKQLQRVIDNRRNHRTEESYTSSLFEKGVHRIAQKVGEEAVETVIEAIGGRDEDLIYEASDLLFHLMVLMSAKGYSIENLATELISRHK